MAYTPTTNFGLKKPPLGDPADIRLENDNMDSIDTIMHQNRLMLAEPFDQTKDYAKGKMVVYEGASYKFITNHTAGNWDASEVEPMPVADGATGGGSDVTKRVTGNPVEFSDGADAPLVKCTTAITGSQDLHGYDKPWVGGAGKNLLSSDRTFIIAENVSGTWTGDTYVRNGVTFEVEYNNTGYPIKITANGTNSTTGSFVFVTARYPFTLDTEYIINGLNNGSMETGRINIQGVANYVDGDNLITGDGDTHRIGLQIAGSATVNNVIWYPMLRYATVTDPTFAPYENICPITAYTEGEIVERGKNIANVVSNNVTITRNVTAVFGTNNSVAITGDGGTYSRICIAFPCKVGQSYTISLKAYSDGSYRRLCLLKDPNQNEWGDINLYRYIQITNTESTYTLKFTAINDYVGLGLYISTNTLLTASFVAKEVMMVDGNTALPYEPYVSATHTATFSQAIYQGNADFVGGSVGAVKIKLSKKWSEGLSTTVIGNYTRKAFVLPSNAVPNDPSAICNVAPRILNYTTDELHFYVATETALVFLPNDTDGNTDIEIAYELATPTTSSITPTNLPIKSLFGYNHIESSTGEMEIEYITGEYQPLVDLIESSGGGSSYQCDLLYGNESDWSYVDFKPSATQTVELAHAYTDYDVLVIVCTGASYGAYVAHVPVLVRAIKDASGTKNGLMCISFNIWLAPAFSVVDSTHLKMEGMDSNNPMRLYRIYGMKW